VEETLFLGSSPWFSAITCDTIFVMETVKTIICKLDPVAAQAAEIDQTLVAFANACNHIAEVSRRENTTNKVIFQHACYREVRATFGLSANLAIRAIARVCAALKIPQQRDSCFEPTSIDYDARIFSFREVDWTFSLTLLRSRQRLATLLGERQRQALRDRKPTSAELVKRKDGNYFLHVQLIGEAPQPIKATDHIGVDLGIASIATDSDGNQHSGKPVDAVRRKHHLQRQRLQRRNSKGARKKIKRVGSKEARFRRHQNHVISKRLVETAKRTGRGIAVEELTGIRERVRARGSEARNRLSGWSFHQLRQFIDYKALATGIPVRTVDPRHTSRTCSGCGHCAKANRQTQESFACKHCGFSCNADWNAARNIRALANRNLATELAGATSSATSA
jgi:putative transposase